MSRSALLAILLGLVAAPAAAQTINLTTDPACDLDYAHNRVVERPVEVALSNSFGFGGHNVTLAIARWHE